MICYGSGGCGGCLRYIQRVEQPLVDADSKKEEPAQPRKKPRRPKNKAVRPRRIPVLCIERCELFPSIAKAAEWIIDQGLASNYDTASGAISNVLAGRQQVAYGMHWRRMDGKN